MKFKTTVMVGIWVLESLVRSSTGLTWGSHGEALWGRLWTKGSDAFMTERIAALERVGLPVPSPETYLLEVRPSWYEELSSGFLGNFQIWDESRCAWFDVANQKWYFESVQKTPAGLVRNWHHFAIPMLLRDQHCTDPTPNRRFDFRKSIEMKFRVFNHVTASNAWHSVGSHPARVLFLGTTLSPHCDTGADNGSGQIAFDQRIATAPRGGSVEVTPRKTNMTIDRVEVVYNVP